MREGKTSEARFIISTENVNRMRQNKRVFFDPKLQSKLASLPRKPRKPFSKTEYSKIAFKKGMIWVNDVNVRIVISPGAYESPIQVADVLALCPQWSSIHLKLKTAFLASPKKLTLYVGVIRLISGWRDLKTNKGIFRVGPWP